MTYEQVDQAVSKAGLTLMGALQQDGATLVLVGTGPRFWGVFTTSPERLDGKANPVDRWSQRVVGNLAHQFQAQAIYPFGGPPYEPFITWALQSGRAWQSPVGMLVHDTVGMMLSYRGALRFGTAFAIPTYSAASPCDSCADQPCTTACPVDALGTAHSYDVDRCHAYLDTHTGQDCMTLGCAARRACPVSRLALREPQQSKLHMKAFHQT